MKDGAPVASIVCIVNKTRGNAEVQRRAQEVINACVALGHDNPIKFIHGTSFRITPY